MRTKSKKRARREREAKPFREALVARVGRCENCGAKRKLCVHEIANGTNRQKALDQPYAVLVLCWACNGGPFENKGEWPESRQLALLRARRPSDFDLAAYLELTSPNAPRRIELWEVVDWMTRE